MDFKFLKNKRVLVTGCCGSVGSLLVEELLKTPVLELVGLDNNETELFFNDQKYFNEPRMNTVLGDIRDVDRLTSLFKNIDIVFHAAAYKHVGLCEKSPFEAVQTNINGVQNIIAATLESNVQTVIFTSSDKGVNPTSVMGTSKLMGERLITAAHADPRARNKVFASTRFGNVLGSRGSVLPIFHRQIAKGGPITLTDPDMTRFIMTHEQAVKLVIETARIARGGEVFVTKMPVVRIEDLARVMIKILAPRYNSSPDSIDIKVIGTKPAEKMYEELMSHEEVGRTLELKDYFVVLPAFRGFFDSIEYKYQDVVSQTISMAYKSSKEQTLSISQLEHFLVSQNLLDKIDYESEIDHRLWPGEGGA
ncbi:MAG: polysaccharide biosynthesis protein [Magnetococcales bacterium]|nr:polysaccharide biosynthesis protein [Magnetococcales bacterium]